MSNQSSSIDSLTSLELGSKYLYQYGGIILLVLGNIGCIFNILIFTKRTLRQNPCSTYFIAGNIFDMFFIDSLFLSTTLETGYNRSITTKSIVLCRLMYYVSLFSNVLSSYCLILASIDRVLVTSPNVLTRQRSTLTSSYVLILCGTIFWLLFHSPSLIFTNITYIDESLSICFYQIGFYLTFISYYSIIKETSSIVLLLFFGLWTIRNIRRLRHVGHLTRTVQSRITTENAPRIIHSKDRQYVSMVLVDIVVFTICSSTAAMFLTEQQISQYQQKSIEQIKLEIFFKYLVIFVLHIPFASGCYTNLLVSKTYRNAIKNLLSRN